MFAPLGNKVRCSTNTIASPFGLFVESGGAMTSTNGVDRRGSAVGPSETGMFSTFRALLRSVRPVCYGNPSTELSARGIRSSTCELFSAVGVHLVARRMAHDTMKYESSVVYQRVRDLVAVEPSLFPPYRPLMMPPGAG